jgi:L-rhamnose mutarotase
MKRVVVRYKVKPGRADENAELIKAVFADLAETSPAGLRYASFVADDGLTFVHVASIETDDDSNPLAASAAFKAFQAEIKDRCEEPPQATWMTEVGSYRFFDS